MPPDPGLPGRIADCGASDGAVKAEQIRLLLQNPVDVPVNLINTGLVGLIVWPLYPAWVLALWLTLVGIVSVARALLRRRYARATGDSRMSPIWARAFTANAFVAGCLWGLCASVILMTPDPVYYNFIVFVLGGTMAGGIVCIAVNLRAMLAFILPTIVPAIAALAVHGGLVQIDMAVMLALFTGALVWTGHSINRSITENVRLRFGQEALVNKLAFANLLLRTQMEASLDGMLVVDENKAIVVFNQRFAAIWRIPPVDLAAGGDGVVLAKVTASVKDAGNFMARLDYLNDHPGEDSHDECETTDGRSIDRYTVTLYSPTHAYLGRAWFFRDGMTRSATRLATSF